MPNNWRFGRVRKMFRAFLATLTALCLWSGAAAAEPSPVASQAASQVDIPDGELTLHATLYRPDGKAAALFEAHWADWDQQGRLVATVGGRVLAGRLTKHNKLQWRQLASMQNERPAPMEAPAWAQQW